MKTFIRLAIATVSILAMTASAAPAALVVAIQYQIRENNPELLENAVTTPLERVLQKVDRVEAINTTTTHGRVDAEIHFKGEASEQDLAATTRQVEQLKFAPALEITSRTIELRQARLQ
jgi:multidrug efflux pump subunit AcrB